MAAYCIEDWLSNGRVPLGPFTLRVSINNVAMTLAILVSLKKYGLQGQFGVTPLFSTRTVWLVLLQH